MFLFCRHGKYQQYDFVFGFGNAIASAVEASWSHDRGSIPIAIVSAWRHYE